LDAYHHNLGASSTLYISNNIALSIALIYLPTNLRFFRRFIKTCIIRVCTISLQLLHIIDPLGAQYLLVSALQ